MALTTDYDSVKNREGMLSVGDQPFTLLLPEPILSGLRSRLFLASSNEEYVPGT